MHVENPVLAFSSAITKVAVITISARAADPSQMATSTLGSLPENCASVGK